MCQEHSLGNGANAAETVVKDLQRLGIVRIRREPKVRFERCSRDDARHRLYAKVIACQATAELLLSMPN